jgi:transcriptional regulator with XRE-family HTH domain
MDKRERVWKSLENKEYRELFAEDVGTGLAFQVKLMREKRGWTQEELGLRTGKKQGVISQLENPDYGHYSLATLKKLAAAFDVGLIVKFTPFSELVSWITDLSPSKLAPPSYEEERQMSLAEAPGGSSEWTPNVEEGSVSTTVPLSQAMS